MSKSNENDWSDSGQPVASRHWEDRTEMWRVISSKGVVEMSLVDSEEDNDDF
jgi:hypothetical protein